MTLLCNTKCSLNSHFNKFASSLEFQEEFIETYPNVQDISGIYNIKERFIIHVFSC